MVDMKSGTTTSDPDVDFVALPPGEKIGRYEVLSVLGQGGFGITYRARDIQLEREVAIKEYLPVSLAIRQDGHTVLPRSTKVAEDFTWGRDRFVAEGRTLATLHRAPGIVRVFDFLEFNGTAYIVMELLHGDTLETRLKTQGRLDPDAVDRILWTLLDGLEEVHNAGFLHRDIKPANILLDAKGNPTLIDFGASRAAMAGRTVAMTAIFTPGYAAAEQFTSAKQGPWTDIYGLAATLYHAISGATPPSAFDRMLDDSYEPIARHAGPDFTAGLLAGIDVGLAVRASDRPQSIAGWRAILSMTAAPDAAETVMAGHRQSVPAATILAARPAPPTTAAPAPVPEPVAAAAETPATAPAPAKSRVPLYGALAVAMLVLAGIGGYFALSPPGPKPPRPSAALQDLKIEDLERVLAERRKADAAAAEKKRLEEEAQQKAEADAAAKKAADAELEKAQQARRQAEQELAQMKADMEARRRAEAGQREQADAVARRAAEEAAQQKAEAEMAALKQAEEDAKLKAAADAETQRQADEALAKAQAERQRADSEARQRAEAEAKQKAESSAKQIAEAEARQKAEAEAQQKVAAEAKLKAEAEAEGKRKAEAEAAAAMDKKAAEAAETALNLAAPDRQRIQVALTSLGFDTHGYDGAFGPRSREAITGWQNARSQLATGHLTGTQHQALLREAVAALSKYDDEQKKIEEEKKKKADDEAKTRAAAALTMAPSTATAAAGPGAFDGTYGGVLSSPRGVRPATVRVSNGRGTGTITLPRCGAATISFSVSPTGDINGSGETFDQNCSKISCSLDGRGMTGQLQLKVSCPGGIATGTVTRGAAASATAAPAQPAVTPAAAAATPSAGTARWTGQAKCGQWDNSLPLNVPVANGQGTATARGAARATVTVTISGNRYSGNLSWSPRVNTAKILSASFSGTISGNTISATPHSRADISGGPGPNDAPCTIDLARTP